MKKQKTIFTDFICDYYLGTPSKPVDVKLHNDHNRPIIKKKKKYDKIYGLSSS